MAARAARPRPPLSIGPLRQQERLSLKLGLDAIAIIFCPKRRFPATPSAPKISGASEPMRLWQAQLIKEHRFDDEGTLYH
jgi:hypothetical protein